MRGTLQVYTVFDGDYVKYVRKLSLTDFRLSVCPPLFWLLPTPLLHTYVRFVNGHSKKMTQIKQIRTFKLSWRSCDTPSSCSCKSGMPCSDCWTWSTLTVQSWENPSSQSWVAEKFRRKVHAETNGRSRSSARSISAYEKHQVSV